jgi:protein-S-isoprenylcysteine O-methyltransferase Ste14
MNRLPIFLGFFGVVACWIVFAVIFLSQGKAKRGGEERKEQVSRWGVILQSLSYSVAWMTPRKYSTPLLSDSVWVGWIEAVTAVALSVASVWLCWWALQALGRNWSVVARVTDEHELVRTGPYAWVRNPIYAGMLGMLIATALVISQWWGALIAIVIFHIGTMVRVKSEERLLAAQFGQKFDEYRKEVPAYLPGVRI